MVFCFVRLISEVEGFVGIVVIFEDFLVDLVGFVDVLFFGENFEKFVVEVFVDMYVIF